MVCNNAKETKMLIDRQTENNSYLNRNCFIAIWSKMGEFCLIQLSEFSLRSNLVKCNQVRGFLLISYIFIDCRLDDYVYQLFNKCCEVVTFFCQVS